MICPKCQSENVSVQAVSVTKTKNHSVLWWIFVSWWWWILWAAMFLPMLVIKLIWGKKTTTKIHSEAVCQDCGHRWKIKKV